MSIQAQEVTATAEWPVPKSPEALGFCLAEAAHELTGRPIGVVVRDSVMNVATIVATSTGACKGARICRVRTFSKYTRSVQNVRLRNAEDGSALVGFGHPHRRL